MYPGATSRIIVGAKPVVGVVEKATEGENEGMAWRSLKGEWEEGGNG